MNDADELEHMLRRAGVQHAWSRNEHAQLCLNVGQAEFSFDAASQLLGLADVDVTDTPVAGIDSASLADVRQRLRQLRGAAAPDLWPVYDRALRALDSL